MSGTGGDSVLTLTLPTILTAVSAGSSDWSSTSSMGGRRSQSFRAPPTARIAGHI
jgi:hypothetical protein